MRLSAVFLTLLFIPSFAFAGFENGNGGDVVVCGSETTLLDFFSTEIAVYPRDLGPKNLSAEEKVSLAINRLNRVDPKRSKLYRKWFDSFEREAVRLHDLPLPRIYDTGPIEIPKDCEVHQIAIQKDVPDGGPRPRYLINQDLYLKLDNDGRAGLILHEIIYREAHHCGTNDSMGVRQFNTLVSSRAPLEFTRGQYTTVSKVICERESIQQ